MMKAVVLERQHELAVKRVKDVGPPAPGEVTVRVTACGICGSDCHYLDHGRIGDFVVEGPLVLGHEAAGVVVAVGDGVAGLSVGDRVALEPGIPCRACDACRTGKYNLCAGVRFFATPPVDGALVSRVNHPADFAHKLPDGVSDEEGALCEPMSVGVYACRRAGVAPGHRVLVLGAGPVGIICMKVAFAFGALEVVITDVSGERLAAATRHGATETINVATAGPGWEARFAGAFDAAIECCGVESATGSAIRSTKSGGTVCLVGLGAPDMRLPIFQVAVREVDVRGIFRYANTYPTCISLIASGAVDMKSLVTDRFSLDDAVQGFARAKQPDAMKVMFSSGFEP